MSDRTKLAGKLPGDEPVNGVDMYVPALTQRWDRHDPDNPPVVMVLGLLRLNDYRVMDKGNGTFRQGNTEIVRIETLGVSGSKPLTFTDEFGGESVVLDVVPAAVKKLLLDAAESRTGAEPLPIDALSEIDNHTVLGDDED